MADTNRVDDFLDDVALDASVRPPSASTNTVSDTSRVDDFLSSANSAVPTAPVDDGSTYSNTAKDFLLNLASKGAIGTAKIPNQIAAYATDKNQPDITPLPAFYSGAPGEMPPEVVTPKSQDASDVNDAIHSGSMEALQKMTALQNAIEAQKSNWSKSAAQNQPIFTPAQNKNDILPFDIHAPSVSQLSNMAGGMAPSIGLFELGGEPAALAESLGAGTVGQTAARVGGYGAANTALSAPAAYEDTYNQSYADSIKNGKSATEADQIARNAADQVVKTVAPLAFAAGGIGGKIAPEMTGIPLMRGIKGAAAGSAPMAAQMGGQYIAEQKALGRPVDPYELASQAATGALTAAPLEGGIAIREGKRFANTSRPEILNASGNPTPDKSFNQSTGRMEDIGGNQPEQASPVAPVQAQELSPATDIDTAKTTLDAVKTGDLDNVHPDVLNDLAKSGEIQINDGEKPALTDLGNKLLDEINNLPPSDQNVTPQSATQELPTPANANGEDKLLSFTNETAPEAAPLVSDFAEKRLRDLWIEHDALPSDSPLRKSIIDEMDSIVQESPVFQNMKGLSKIGDEKPTPIATEEATPEEQKAQEDYQVEKSDIPFKATESNPIPTERFAAQQDNIKGKLNNIIKRINPDVKTEFADKLFGEGEAIKASGGDSTGRQEVAGSYNKAENLIKASLNVDKWDVADTVYHEAYHSIRDMVKPEDDAVLKKAFPGTDKLAQTEHEAIEFGRFMTQKNATGFAPAVRRIFLAIRQALRDIGRTFKLGKFNSVEDIFNRAERGSVYKDYQDAIRSGDVESLKGSTLPSEQQEQAVKEVSPALHDVVYKAMSEDDEQALHNLNVEAHGTPEEKATAIGNDVYGRLGNAVNKGLDSAESAKEKMLRGGLELAKPFIGEKTYKQAQRRTEAAIAKTKRNATSLNIRRTTADVAQIVMSSNDGHLRAIAARTKSPTVESLADILHPDPGHAKGLGRGYHEEIAHFTNKTLSQVARILHDTIEQKDKDAVRNYMTNPSSMTAEAVKSDPNARTAGHLSHMIQEMRDHLAAAGYEVPQTEGFYPRIYDNSSIVNNESAFKKDAVKAYYDTYKEDFQSMYDAMKSSHARDLNEQRTQERLLAENGVHASEKPYGKRTNDELQLAREKRLDNVNSKYLDADGNLIPYKDFVLRFVKDRVEAWYNNILLQDDGITSDPNGYFKNVSTIPDAPSSFRQRVLSKAADDILSNWMVKDPLSAMNKLAIQTGRKAGWEKFFGGDKLNQLHQGMIKDGLNGTDIGHVMDILRSNTGQLGGSINRQVKNALALSRYWTAVRFLTKAPFKHLSISLNAGAHTGNPVNAWRTLVDSTHALFKTDKSQAMRIYAELAGITGESAEHAMLLNQSGMMSDNEKINFMSNAYYDAVGMTKLIGAHKVGMQRSIQYMLADLADDIVNRKNGWKSAEFMMKNYPVPENEVQGFAQWIKDNGGRDINNSITLGNSKYADMYRASSQRATDQIISNPTAATRQMYASHPLASLIYQLSAYHMTAMKNSLQRNARLFAEGVTGKNYDMRDRLRLVAPLTMYLPAMTLFMYGYNKSKDALFPPDQLDKTNPLAKSVVDADLFGQFNFLAKDIVGSKYLQNKLGYYYHDWDARKSTAKKAYDMLGPDFSMFKDYAKMIGNISDNMSANDRKKSAELKSEYSNIVAPILTSAIATYVPFALPAFAAIQAINHPAIRRAVTKAVK